MKPARSQPLMKLRCFLILVYREKRLPGVNVLPQYKSQDPLRIAREILLPLTRISIPAHIVKVVSVFCMMRRTLSVQFAGVVKGIIRY